MKKFLFKLFPWLITAAALYYAFNGVDWRRLLDHIGEARMEWIAGGVLLGISSYFVRAIRWQNLFPARENSITFSNSYKVLKLGFFMNNILPARAGEFVRAHMGAKVTGERRTLVFATVASERLVDGIVISLMFVIFALGVGDAELSKNLFYVALLFGGATFAVILTLILRNPLFRLAERLNRKMNNRALDYTLTRIKVFVEGLAPLCTLSHLPTIILWSVLVWSIELAGYACIANAFNAALSLPYLVLFLVAVNFSSLIPAAPGGIGVIEAVASKVLMSIGIPQEQALTMVMCQHLIQYLVVGIPGAIIMFTWKDQIKQIDLEEKADAEGISG